jgi:hypothetical protein
MCFSYLQQPDRLAGETGVRLKWLPSSYLRTVDVAARYFVMAIVLKELRGIVERRLFEAKVQRPRARRPRPPSQHGPLRLSIFEPFGQDRDVQARLMIEREAVEGQRHPAGGRRSATCEREGTPG